MASTSRGALLWTETGFTNRSSFADQRQPTVAPFGAMAGNLRLNHERRLVDQTGASWNRISLWLSRIKTLRVLSAMTNPPPGTQP